MNLLALETSTERLSLAVLLGERLLLRDVDAGQRHSELALPLLRELLAEAGVALRDLDAIAFGQGPGSFTGVRIACGLTQGIALGAGKRVVPVPTQMALAEQADADNVLVALDARMGEIYLAAYRRSAAVPCGWQAEIAPMLAGADALPGIGDGEWIGIGSAFDAPALSAAVTLRYGEQVAAIRPAALPSAGDVARIAARMLAASSIGSALAPEQAAPLYLRNKVAMTIAEREQLRTQKAPA